MTEIEMNIDFAKIKPSPQIIMESMGYNDGKNFDVILNSTKELIAESQKYTESVGGYKIFADHAMTIESGKMYLDAEIFELDKIIAKQLLKCSSIAFIAVTLGNKFDEWINQYFKNGDPFLGFIADTIGSEMAENTADVIESQVNKAANKNRLKCTNRYSPGYCGWNVFEQHKFFSLLPDKFCGIELSESALMTPVKSVSAVIGIGEKCEKKEYQCSLCSLENCYKRNRQEKAQL